MIGPIIAGMNVTELYRTISRLNTGFITVPRYRKVKINIFLIIENKIFIGSESNAYARHRKFTILRIVVCAYMTDALTAFELAHDHCPRHPAGGVADDGVAVEA